VSSWGTDILYGVASTDPAGSFTFLLCITTSWYVPSTVCFHIGWCDFEISSSVVNMN